MTLGAGSSYDIGVDFQNAQRGGLFATQIGDEFVDPNDPSTDSTFTRTNSATLVPEPSTLLYCGIVGGSS